MVTLTLGAGDSSATKDTDYTVNTALSSITIPANQTSATGTLELTPTDDSVVEGDETIIVSGTTTVGLDVSDASITLTDDDKSTADPGDEDDKDSAELSISGPSSNVNEGSDATFTVTLSAAVSKQVQVAWSAPLSADAAEASDLGSTSGDGDLRGGIGCWVDGEHHHHRHGRRAVGDGGELHGDSGDDRRGAVEAGFAEERVEQRPGDHRRERPDHHRAERPLER